MTVRSRVFTLMPRSSDPELRTAVRRLDIPSCGSPASAWLLHYRDDDLSRCALAVYQCTVSCIGRQYTGRKCGQPITTKEVRSTSVRPNTCSDYVEKCVICVAADCAGNVPLLYVAQRLNFYSTVRSVLTLLVKIAYKQTGPYVSLLHRST